MEIHWIITIGNQFIQCNKKFVNDR